MAIYFNPTFKPEYFYPIKNIAKLLAGKARILIDTPYFPQTGVLGMCELVKQFRKQNMTENPSRIINTTTYNEFGTVISHNFVQGSYNINMNQDLTEAVSKIQELIEQLQSQGLAVDIAQEHVAQDIAKQAQKNQNMRGMLVKWGQSLADNAAKTTVSDIVQGTVKLALRAAGIPLP